jgi:hypothetical protein
MNDNFKLLAEGQMGLERKMNEKFDQVDARLHRLDARFDRMDVRFDRMDIEFEQVKANQKITLEYLFNAEERFKVLEKEVKEIKLELIRLGKKMLSPEETAGYSQRIAVIEKDMEIFRVFMNANKGMKPA